MRYEAIREAKWAMYNQDRRPRCSNMAFEVAIVTGSNAFLHRATVGNTMSKATHLDYPLTNGRPGIALRVTPN